MPETDNPLKLLITMYRDVFAAWFLGEEVSRVRPLNVEFPAQAARSDLLFEVIDKQGQVIYLHVELQGRRSSRPMPLRMLDYMTRVVQREVGVPAEPNGVRLHSVVVYVGEGAGREDNGRYTIPGPNEQIALHWQYQPIRLWEMEAVDLLQLRQPALAALIGQTRLQQPARELPQAIDRIRATEPEQKERLLTALISLLPTEEVTQMVEKMLDESEELLLDTPYLRRMRQRGLEEGREEGREEGLKEGRIIGMREMIADGLIQRFDPPASLHRNITRRLEKIEDEELLHRLFVALLQVEDEKAFMDRFQEIVSEKEQMSDE
jgi:predicted transposase YdaD